MGNSSVEHTARGDDRDEISIGDLAREYGLSLRTLRFYEARGLLAPRREGTMRMYRAADRARLEHILSGKRLGFSLTEIRKLMMVSPPSSEGGERHLTAGLDRRQLAAQLAHFEKLREELTAAIEELRGAYAASETNGAGRSG